MKTEVSLEASNTTDLFRVQIDGKNIKFVGSKADVKVTSGKNHVIQWFARGISGQKYAVQITAPKAAEFKHEATLDGDGLDAGHWWFPA